MMVVFRDTAKEIPFPANMREIIPCIRALWAWEVVFFWYLALHLELMLLLFLADKISALQRAASFKQRLMSLADGCNSLSDAMDCDVYFGSEAAFFRRMPKGFRNRARWVFDFILGWALMAEGYFWEYLSEHIGNAKLKELMFDRAVAVAVTGANRLTNGEAFPGIKQ